MAAATAQSRLRAMTMLAELSRELRPPLTAEAAVIEADRCLECGGGAAPAPCVVGCPADVDVPGFVAAIAAGDTAAPRRRSSPRTSSAAPAPASARSRFCASATASSSTRAARPIEIGALQRYATEWAYANGVPLRDPAPPNGKRVAVIGAGPAGLAAAGELAARGYAVTVYDERREIGGLVRYGIAPYRQTNEPLPDEARLLAELGVEFRLRTRIDAARLEELEAEVDAIVVAVGMGADVDVSYEGDDLQGVWESLPFIEHLKTGKPAHVGEARGGHRWRQHRRRRRGRGEAARRGRLAPALPAHRARDAGLRARGRARAARRRRDPLPHEPGRVRRQRLRRGRPLRRDATRRSRRERPPAAGAGPRQRVRRPGRHGRQGDRTAAARRVPRAARVGRRGRTHRRIRRSSPPATPSTAAPASSRPCARQSARSPPSTSRCDARADRDPLARARRTGRQDGRPDPRARAAARGQGRAGVPGVRARAARRPAARVHPHLRPADPPSRLGHGSRPRRRARAVARRRGRCRRRPAGRRAACS